MAKQEIDLAHDVVDWEKLSDNERHFITHVLAFFAASDGNLANFLDILPLVHWLMEWLLSCF